MLFPSQLIRYLDIVFDICACVKRHISYILCLPQFVHFYSFFFKRVKTFAKGLKQAKYATLAIS